MKEEFPSSTNGLTRPNDRFPGTKSSKDITENKKKKKKRKSPVQALVNFGLLMVALVVSYLRTIYHWFVEKKQKNIQGQVCVITGAARGLGRAQALEFAAKGCKIAIADVETDLTKESVALVNQISPNSCKGYYCDVGDFESCSALKQNVLKDFGQVDIVVNNAALVVGGTLLNENLKHSFYEKIAKVNFLSHIHMSKLFLPEMVKRNRGHIVAISSMSGLTGLGNASLYAACKWAITGFMESVREELRRGNPNNEIQFTVVCPYFIRTNILIEEQLKSSFDTLTPEKVAQEIVKGVRQNLFIFSVPKYQYFAAVFLKLLPEELRDRIVDLYYPKMKLE